MKHITELVGKEEIADGTMLFQFRKPEGFQFEAGQFCDFTLINPPETDAEGNGRAFSICSAPEDKDLEITMRMRDTAFKRTLKNANLGMEIEVYGPSGSFTLFENVKRPGIFLVGGIGITPFRSIIKDATFRKLPHRIYLFYSNRRPEDAAFLDELNGLSKKNKNLTFIPTMTEMSKSKRKWNGETGYITGDLVKKYVPDRNNAFYYTAGPQGMVAAMRKLLSEEKVSMDDVKTEEFSGY